MHIFLLYSFSCIFAISSASFAQERSVFQIIGDDISESVLLGIKYCNFPSRFDSKDWRNFAGTTALTLSLNAFDKNVQSGTQDIATKRSLDASMNLFRQYGEVKYALGGSTGIYFAGLASGSDKIRRLGKNLLQTLVYSSVVTTSMKVIFGRARPFKDEGAFSYHPLNLHDENMSLPSGHTTVAFALSSVLAAEIDNTYASIGLYTLASLTGFSRMYENKHWLSDVFLGAVIGTSTGYFVVHEDKQESSKESEANTLLIQPTLSGVSLLYTF